MLHITAPWTPRNGRGLLEIVLSDQLALSRCSFHSNRIDEFRQQLWDVFREYLVRFPRCLGIINSSPLDVDFKVTVSVANIINLSDCA